MSARSRGGKPHIKPRAFFPVLAIDWPAFLEARKSGCRVLAESRHVQRRMSTATKWLLPPLAANADASATSGGAKNEA
jgi:hypothetical protein